MRSEDTATEALAWHTPEARIDAKSLVVSLVGVTNAERGRATEVSSVAAPP